MDKLFTLKVTVFREEAESSSSHKFTLVNCHYSNIKHNWCQGFAPIENVLSLVESNGMMKVFEIDDIIEQKDIIITQLPE